MSETPELAKRIRASASKASQTTQNVAQLRLLAYGPWSVPRSVEGAWARLSVDAVSGAASAIQYIKPIIVNLQRAIENPATVPRIAAKELRRLEEMIEPPLPAPLPFFSGPWAMTRTSQQLLYRQAHAAIQALSTARQAPSPDMRTVGSLFADLSALQRSTHVPFWKSEGTPLDEYWAQVDSAIVQAIRNDVSQGHVGLGDLERQLVSRSDARAVLQRRTIAVIEAAAKLGVTLPTHPTTAAQREDWAAGLEAVDEKDLGSGRTFVPKATFLYNDAGLCAYVAEAGRTYKKVAGVIGYRVTPATANNEVVSYSTDWNVERRAFPQVGQWVVRSPHVDDGPNGERNRWIIADMNGRYDTSQSTVTAKCESELGEVQLPPLPTFIVAVDNVFGELQLTHENGDPKYSGHHVALACDLVKGETIRPAVRTIPDPERIEWVDAGGVIWTPPPAYVQVSAALANSALTLS